MANFLFYAFAFFTVATAAGVVASKNAVNAAMCLLLSLVGVAGLFVALNAYLLAFLLLLVYAGAIVALFLFIVMLLDMKETESRGFGKLSLAAIIPAAGLLVTGLSTLVTRGHLDTGNPALTPALGTDIKLYSYQLFTTYLLPVQVMGFLLLIAMLGVIVLSKRWEGSDDVT